MRAVLRKNGIVALAVGLLAFSVYMRTLAHSIQYGDSPELTVAVYQLGVAHPTGYPLYMLIGNFFMRLLPLASPAYALNLLSATCASLALALVYLIGVRVVRSRAASVVATLLLAFSLTYWSQAVVTEVYALHMLLMAAVLLCILKWDRSGDRRWILSAGGLFGLSLTNHSQTVLLIPALVYFLATSARRSTLWREAGWLTLLVLAPLVLYLYLPLAAFRDPAANWGDTRTLHNFWLHITGAQYRDLMGIRSVGELKHRLMEFAGPPIEDINPGHLFSEFSPYVIWLAPVGVISLFRRQRRLLVFTALYFVVTVVYALSYRIPDIDAYYIPSNMILALWIGCGIRQIRGWILRFWNRMERRAKKKWWLRPGYNLVMCTLPALLLSANWLANDHRNDHSAISMSRTILAFLKPNAIVIGGGDEYVLPILYPRYVEQRRTDVEIIPLDDVIYRDRARLITRLRSPQFRVNVPAGYLEGPGGFKPDYALLRAVIADNLPYRPVYILGAHDDVLHHLRDDLHLIPDYERVPGPTVPLVLVTAKRAKTH